MSNLPFDDTTDFANADRGFITALEPGKQLIDSLAVRVDGPRA
ncbi:hypothetical protein AB0N60_06945 [Streptomyces microflavus]